jgi:SAM-dependent methyltransferase
MYFWLDYFNDFVNPFNIGSIALPVGDDLVFEGWAADQNVDGAASAVRIVLDNQCYETEYGRNRPDVSEYFSSTAYSKTGFKAILPSSTYQIGLHEIKLQVVGANGWIVSESPTLKFEAYQRQGRESVDAEITQIDSARPKPGNYGEWWNNNGVDLEWYKMIYGFRSKVHQHFAMWFEQLAGLTKIESILEIGCGRGYPYADFFEKYSYLGCDISKKEIDWCVSERHNPRHSFECYDFLEIEPTKQYDLVFSHGVIDHVYDVNRFLRNAAKASRSALFVTAYRGWFPDLQSHKYAWTDSVTCYHNSISPCEAKAVLISDGWQSVDVLPLRCDNPHDGVSLETAIIALT